MTVPRTWPTRQPVSTTPRPLRVAPEIVYPESDGQPVGETQLHFDWMVWLVEVTRPHLAEQGIHVGANLFFYHVEGDPRQCFCPDYFAIRDCDPARRFRVIKLWEEPLLPCFVLETTSAATRQQDQHDKRSLYRRLGVAEYFLFDPTGDWLEPRLQGYRLARQRYVRVQPEKAAVGGGLLSRTLGLYFVLEGDRLRLFAGVGGAELLSGRELAAREAQRAAAEAAARVAAEQARAAEAQRAAAAEAALLAERQLNAELLAQLVQLRASSARQASTPKDKRSSRKKNSLDKTVL